MLHARTLGRSFFFLSLLNFIFGELLVFSIYMLAVCRTKTSSGMRIASIHRYEPVWHLYIFFIFLYQAWTSLYHFSIDFISLLTLNSRTERSENSSTRSRRDEEANELNSVLVFFCHLSLSLSLFLSSVVMLCHIFSNHVVTQQLSGQTRIVLDGVAALRSYTLCGGIRRWKMLISPKTKQKKWESEEIDKTLPNTSNLSCEFRHLTNVQSHHHQFFGRSKTSRWFIGPEPPLLCSNCAIPVCCSKFVERENMSDAITSFEALALGFFHFLPNFSHSRASMDGHKRRNASLTYFSI